MDEYRIVRLDTSHLFRKRQHEHNVITKLRTKSGLDADILVIDIIELLKIRHYNLSTAG